MHFPGKTYKDVLIRRTEFVYSEETAFTEEEVTYQMLVNEGYTEEMIEELEEEYGIKLERPKTLFQIKSNSLTSGDSNEENLEEEIITPEDPDPDNPNPDDPISEEELTPIESIVDYYVSSVCIDTYNYVDEIAKIERWPYAGTNMAMMGFKTVSDGSRMNVDIKALDNIIRNADSTRKVVFLYTENDPIFSTDNISTIFNNFPYLKTLIAPKATSLRTNDFLSLNMSLIDLPKIKLIQSKIFADTSLNYSQNCIVDKLLLSGCTEIASYAFYGATIKQIEVPSVRTIGNLGFCKVKDLLSITLPKIITIPERCFESAYALQTIFLPKCQKIEFHAFEDCSNLTSVYLGSDSIVDIDKTWGAFGHTPLVSTDTSAAIYVPSSLVSAYSETYASFPFSDKFKPIVGDIL